MKLLPLGTSLCLLTLLLTGCSSKQPKLERIPEDPSLEAPASGDYFPSAKLPEEKTIIVGVRSEKALDEDGALGSERELNGQFEKIPTKFKIWANTIEDLGLPAPKKVPFLVRWCGGEWCSFVKDFKLTHERKLYKDADSSSKVLENLPQGEVLTKAAIFTKVIKVGKYTKMKESYPIITYSGEGNWIMYDDQELDTVEYFAGDEEAKLIEPKVEEWLLVETNEGTVGWIKEVNRHTLPFRPSR